MNALCRSRFAGWTRVLAGWLAGCGLAGAMVANEAAFGFTGPEIFPLDNQIGQLRAADLDGDGLQDLVVANNARSKITLLFNQTGRTNPPATPRVRREINELPPDARFRLESIASEKRIASLVVTDLNRDGRPDLAYYGEPRGLVVQYNQGSNMWSAPKRWALEDGDLTANGLVAGDLNGDGRTDLLLLAENHLHFLAQRADGSLAEPEKIPFSGKVKAMQILDLDGDGRRDLLEVNWEDASPLRFRRQQAEGQLGPEMYFPFLPIRAFAADNLAGNGETHIVTIAQLSGRAQVSHFVRKPAERLGTHFFQGQFQVLPLHRTTKPRRGLGWVELNGDGRGDLVVAEPESGQLAVHFQQADGSFTAARKFPTLSGVSELAVADWDGDGHAEIFLLSTDERAVGVTRPDANQRLPFPRLIPLEGRPLALAVGALRSNEPPALAVLVDQDGRRSLMTRTAAGATQTQKLADTFKANPSALAFHDLNQDGLNDLLTLIPYEKLKLLVQRPERDFEEVDLAPPGGTVEQPWMTTMDVDGDGRAELLLAQKNFLRAVVLAPEATAPGSTNKPGWIFTVKEQINGAASTARLIAAAGVPTSRTGVPALFLLDADRKALTLCERDAAGVWQVMRDVSLPAFTDFVGLTLQAVTLGDAARPAVAVLGRDAVGWLALEGDIWELAELDSYETPIKDGRLMDVVTGDLNQDGRKDLVFLETARNYLDLVIFSADAKLVPANRWQVFEERTFRSRRSDLPEPREAVVADVTGDGKNDLIIVVHDRVLVYPQE